MNEAYKLAEMQRTNIEFERQRHLANWLVKSSPHMAAAAAAGSTTTTSQTTTTTLATTATTSALAGATNITGSTVGGGGGVVVGNTPSNSAAAACNVGATAAAAAAAGSAHHGHVAVEGRKPKLRRFNSHDTSSNMFSVADFENARLARRNEIELKQRLARRLRNSANGSYGLGAGGGAGSSCGGGAAGYLAGYSWLNGSGDYSTGDSKTSKGSSEDPLPADIFLERYSLPRVVRIQCIRKSSNETLQSSSSNGSSTATAASSSNSSSTGLKNTANSVDPTGTNSSSSAGSGNNNNNNHNSNNSNGGPPPPTHDELFLLYRLVRQRQIYHGHNAKTQASQRKKTVLIPQEFPGYFSMLNEKGLPMATQYNSLMQLVRERVYKFASVDNMPAFTESSPSNASSPIHEGCLPVIKGRPQYVKTTARGGQVFRLLAVFEDGKQEHQQQSGGGNVLSSSGGSAAANGSKPHGHIGREKEKGRYAQLLNENRQVMYVPLATKGKFYEIEPGIPQLLQKLSDVQRKLNPECVYRLGALVSAAKQLPLTLRYISGPQGAEIPEQLCISQVSKEDVIIGCPIEDAESQNPLQLRKIYLNRDMQLLRSYLGFDSEQRMLANANVQNMLKFCQFNCDQFLKLVEVELMQRSERSGSKSREGLRILKPLHFPKLLRREKSTMAAHEKEDSIIFLSKSDLEHMEAKEAAAAAAAAAAATASNGDASSNRISERMKVFQSTKKKWFRKQQHHHPQQQQQQDKPQSELDLDEQAKRMSMERYTDMSKLLQERFGSVAGEPNERDADAVSLNSGVDGIGGASDTETTTITTTLEPKSLDTLLQKSMSLQDIELLNGQRKATRPDLLSDAISEAGTELEDLENQTPPPQSFITEKLYNEFHVKTRQYSKSSSSLHQMRHFSLPQKLQLHEEDEREKRSMSRFKAQQQSLGKVPITGRRAAGGVSLLGGGGLSAASAASALLSPTVLPSPTSLVEDDLPYSSVRDSLVISSDNSLHHEDYSNQNCRNDGGTSSLPASAVADYTKENIYAEICPPHHTFSGATLVTRIQDADADDDDGDYASLRYPVPGASNGPQSVSRIEINGPQATNSSISYHTVYLGEEPLGERHTAHITTVELAGEDNIYNTLK